MQINLRDSGTFIFMSDHCHVIENWRDGIPQGWLARDHPAWVCTMFRLDKWLADMFQFRSTQRLKQLVRTTRGRVIPGHDEGTFNEIKHEKEVYT